MPGSAQWIESWADCMLETRGTQLPRVVECGSLTGPLLCDVNNTNQSMPEQSPSLSAWENLEQTAFPVSTSFFRLSLVPRNCDVLNTELASTQNLLFSDLTGSPGSGLESGGAYLLGSPERPKFSQVRLTPLGPNLNFSCFCLNLKKIGHTAQNYGRSRVLGRGREQGPRAPLDPLEGAAG